MMPTTPEALTLAELPDHAASYLHPDPAPCLDTRADGHALGDYRQQQGKPL